MSATRKAQRRHALDRLRERYEPQATARDLAEVEELARREAALGRGYAAPFSDARIVTVDWRGHKVIALWVPRFQCLRTILPSITGTPT